METNFESWLDEALEDLAADREPEALTQTDDYRAAAMMRRLAEISRERSGLYAWWQERSASLKRQAEFLEARLRDYGLVFHKERGIKKFPVGPGRLSVSKARAVTHWDVEALWPWARDVGALRPAEAALDKARIKEMVSWSKPDEKGLSVAVLETGEEVPGYIRDERPGQFNVTVHTGGE